MAISSASRALTRALLVFLTAWLAVSLPARAVLAYLSPDFAAAIGSPYLRALPSATLVVIAATVILHAVLMVVVVREVWKLSRVIQTGVFFSKENVATIRRAGIYLMILSALGVVAMGLAILSVAMSGRPVDFTSAWGQVFNLPIGALVCGLLSLLMAEAFERALKLDKEARLTV